MAIGAVTARIITQYSDKGSKAAARDINKLGKNFDKFAGKVGKAFGLAAAAAQHSPSRSASIPSRPRSQTKNPRRFLPIRSRTPQEQQTQRSQRQKLGSTRLSEHSESLMTNLSPALCQTNLSNRQHCRAQALLGLALDVSAGGNVDLTVQRQTQ
jgi:hypothetical protein